MTEVVPVSSTSAPLSRTERAARAAKKSVALLLERQRDDHWPSDYGGPLFLMPGLLIAHAISEVEIDPPKRQRMLTYLENVQNRDGGFGLHIEGPSTVLGTALNYVALRLLGRAKDAPSVVRCRARLLELGGAEGIPTWGKFWLAVLGVYRWEGISPLPPELWLLPRSLPMHPGNMWCHTRAVFLPMSYLYGRRYSADLPIVRELRSEMFTTPWDAIDWPSLRERIAPGDVYTPHSPYLKAFNRLCAQYERRPSKRLRKRALARTIDMIHHEDETTAYLTIGPVSKAIHMLATWVEDPQSDAFQKHLARVDDYLWDGHDGMKMQGYNGSQLWDVAFTMRALLELRRANGSLGPIDGVLQRAHRFLDRNQVQRDIDRSDRYHRDPIAGGWPFSTAEQGWTVSDCTAEGLKVALEMQAIAERPIARERLEKSVDLILFSQNEDGGWSEYERARGGLSLERMNAAEVFGDIMIGYSYTECTSACIQSLKSFSARFPHHRRAEIEQAIERGARFIESRQRPDGGFYGGWGVCFTYGTWFAIEGLLAAGRSPESMPIRRAARFLLDHQRADGSFSEAFESCVEHRWVQGREPNVVQTSWALLALMALPRDDERSRAIERGIELLLSMQSDDGGWARPPTTGVFNRNCAITYDNYRYYFPLWALARWLGIR
jgi:squalene/oxidosqualene cyclase-like protein